MSRVPVRRTCKLYINGGFVRSESGRIVESVSSATGGFVANVSSASRKDARDAVVAARAAQPRWAGVAAQLRGQVLYRVAEMLEGRRGQFIAELVDADGTTVDEAARQVDDSVDRLVWYAGWADKLTQVHGSVNQVNGPFLNHSAPEPVGVTATAPCGPTLLGLVDAVGATIVSGNTMVVAVNATAAVPAATFAEVLATSDLPGGVVNILSGQPGELLAVLSGHYDVNAVDVSGLGRADAQRCALEATSNLKRVLNTCSDVNDASLRRMCSLVETKTMWHPLGL